MLKRLLPVLLLAWPAFCPAADVNILSPDVGTVFAYHEVENCYGVWNPSRGQLEVRVDFTPRSGYYDQDYPSDSSQLRFKLPGIRLDAAARRLYTTGPGGVRVDIADYAPGAALTRQVRFLPSVQFTLYNFSGTMALRLFATTAPGASNDGNLFVEKNDGFYLNNLVNRTQRVD